MAKKSSKKSMSKWLDLVLLLIAGGMFGFLAMPFISAKITSGLGNIVKTASGYKLLDFENDAGLATIILLFIVFASILAISSLLKFCYDANLTKNKTLGKATNFSVVIIALALVVLSIVSMIVVPTKCESFSLFGASAGNYANWFTLILIAVVSLGGLATAFYSRKK